MPDYRLSTEEHTAFQSLLIEIFGSAQIVLRDCPGCGSKKHSVIHMINGKDMVPALLHIFGLHEKTIKHLPLVYNRCANCGLLFISPTPPVSNVDLFWTTPQMRKKIRQNYSETRKNVWMEEQTYIDDKIRTMNIHYKKARFSRVSKKAVILDIGCGTGVGLEFFFKRGWKRLYGIDPDYYSIAYLRKHKPYIKSFWSDIYSFAKLKYWSFFDLIILDNALEHHTEPKRAIELCSKLLRKGGVLWIAVPNIEGNSIKEKGTKDEKINWGHWSYFSPNSCVHLLKDYFTNAVIYDTYLYRKINLHHTIDLSDFKEDYFQILAKKT